MSVHGFAGSVRKRPGARVADIPEQMRTTGQQAGLEKLMLTVEIRRARENAAGRKSFQRMGEKLVPRRRVMPIVLVADENQIRRRQQLHRPEQGRIPATEFQDSARQLPAPGRLGYRIRSQIDPKIGSDACRSQGPRQRAGLIRPSTGKVQDTKFSHPLEIHRRETLTQQRLQPPDISGGRGMLKGQLLDHDPLTYHSSRRVRRLDHGHHALEMPGMRK
jgi:hypothetical protein